MMTSEDARDEMFSMLRIAWNALAGGVVGGAVPDMIWQGLERENCPTPNVAHGLAHVQHISTRQATIGPPSARRWERSGYILVQCRAPFSGGNGLTIAERLSRIALNAFEGKASAGGIWFRNCRCVENGPIRGWFQVDMTADFTYDEVK